MAKVKLPNSYDYDSEVEEEFEMLEKRLTLKIRDDSDSEQDSNLESDYKGIPYLIHCDDSDS